MKIDWEDHRSGTVLTLSGELLADDVDVMRRRCEDRLVSGLRLVMDIRALERIDSAGLDALLWLHETVGRSAGQFRLVRGDGQPAVSLRATRLERRLPVHATLEEAARSLTRGKAA